MRRLLRKKRSCAVRQKSRIKHLGAGRDYTRAPRGNPQSQYWTFLTAAREAHNDVDVGAKFAEAVIASPHNNGSATVVMINCDSPVQKLIAGGMHQQVTIRSGWLRDVQHAQLREMVFGQ